jgi:endonuclease III
MEFRRTGKIWNDSTRRRSHVTRSVCEAFEREYGRPRFGNPRNPVDDLVYIVLSNKTGPQVAAKTYRDLKRRFASWDDLLGARAWEIRRLLKPAGLSAIKSRQLRGALGKMRRDFGECSVSRLRRLSADEAEAYLKSLQGVSEKVAKCVMMYTLGFEVLPVDAHVHRIAVRLGWTARKRADQCHEELESLVEPRYRFGFHVGCIAHGRAVCRPKGPRCDSCVVRGFCNYFKDRQNDR